MCEPHVRKKYRVFETVAPHDTPAFSDYLRIRWIGVVAHQHRAPGQIFIQQATAHVMYVIAVAVIRGTDGDDRLELGRAPRGHLQGIESTPGLAHHTDSAAAPRLLRDPSDHFQSVVVLLMQIFVEQQSVRIAGASEIDAHGGVSMAREVVVHGLVARACEVTLAVRDVFQDRRNWSRFGVRGQPDAPGQTTTVRHRDPAVFNHPDLMRKSVDGFHRGSVRRTLYQLDDYFAAGMSGGIAYVLDEDETVRATSVGRRQVRSLREPREISCGPRLPSCQRNAAGHRIYLSFGGFRIARGLRGIS